MFDILLLSYAKQGCPLLPSPSLVVDMRRFAFDVHFELTGEFLAHSRLEFSRRDRCNHSCSQVEAARFLRRENYWWIVVKRNRRTNQVDRGKANTKPLRHSRKSAERKARIQNTEIRVTIRGAGG